MSSNEIVLISSDGESFKVDEAVAREFQIVAHMIDDDCADKPIPLTNVTGQDLALVIEYCKTHVEAGVSLEEGEEDKKQVPGEEDKKQVPGEEDKKQVEGEEDKDAKKQVVEAENEENEAKKTALKSWDAEFMKQHNLETIFRLILAANYLNVKGLLDLLCQNVADHIKDKTPGEVRDIFGIENDYTPEEEAAILKENSWAFE